MNHQKKAKKISLMAMLIALEIIFDRFISIETPFLRVSFTFLAIAIMGILFSPLIAGLGSMCADFLGIMLFSKSSAPFFPGFSLSAFLTGFLYSLFFYKKTVTLKKIILVSVSISVGVDLLLNTVWLYMILGPGVFGTLPARMIKTFIMLVFRIILLSIMTKQSLFQKEMKQWSL